MSGTAPGRPRLIAEVLIVLGLSFGQSALYAIVAIINRSTREQSLAQQTTTINTALSDREIFDLIYQLMAVFFDLVPVALVAFLLWRATRPHLARLGVDATRPASDTAWALALAFVIGAGGLVVYVSGRALGWNVNVVATGFEDAYWWTIPVLLLRAATAGITEEVIVIGYLFARLRDLGWRDAWIIVGAAVLRGSYHLYQGFGSFIGNLLMGLVFGFLYTRGPASIRGRVLPFVIAHFVIDAVIFVGYPWAAATFPELLMVPSPSPTPTPSPSSP